MKCPSNLEKGLVGRSGLGFCQWIRFDERNINEMLGQEPNLKLIGSNDVANEEVVGSIVAGLGSLLGHGARFLKKDFVCFEKP